MCMSMSSCFKKISSAFVEKSFYYACRNVRREVNAAVLAVFHSRLDWMGSSITLFAIFTWLALRYTSFETVPNWRRMGNWSTQRLHERSALEFSYHLPQTDSSFSSLTFQTNNTDKHAPNVFLDIASDGLALALVIGHNCSM